MASEVRLVVYDTLIARMSLPGGAIFRWTRRRRELVEHLSIAFAPMRSGELKASINGTYNPRPGRFQVRMEVRASAPHALWVHEGTRGLDGRARIKPHPPNKYLRLSPGNGHPTLYRKSVRGQKANPFMRRALTQVMGSV